MLCNIGLCCSGMLCTFNKGIIDINSNSLMRICLIGLIARQLIVIEGLKGITFFEFIFCFKYMY